MIRMSKESIIRIEKDKYYDSLPIVSTFNNLIDISQKITYFRKNLAETSHYYRYIKQKSTLRCLILTIPILGQLVVTVFDHFKAKRIQYLMQNKRLKKAASWGNLEALFKLALSMEFRRAKFIRLSNFSSGTLEKKDQRILDLYTKAAEQHHLSAFMRLATENYFPTCRIENESFYPVLIKEEIRDLILLLLDSQAKEKILIVEERLLRAFYLFLFPSFNHSINHIAL